jgi:hypothetical protein
VRQTRIGKRRTRTESWRQAPLPPDARDPDIVRAHRLARLAASRGAGRGHIEPSEGTAPE